MPLHSRYGGVERRMEALLKRQFTLVAALAVAGGLSFAALGPASAAPISAPAMAAPTVAKAETSQATAVHHRRGYRFSYRGGRHFRGHVYIQPRRYHRSHRYHRRYHHAPRYYGRRHHYRHHYRHDYYNSDRFREGWHHRGGQ